MTSAIMLGNILAGADGALDSPVDACRESLPRRFRKPDRAIDRRARASNLDLQTCVSQSDWLLSIGSTERAAVAIGFRNACARLT